MDAIFTVSITDVIAGCATYVLVVFFFPFCVAIFHQVHYLGAIFPLL